MTFRELIAARRSVRSYKGLPVEPEKLQAILDAAIAAPSAGDLQSFEVVIVEEGAGKSALAKAASGQGFLASAPLLLVFCADVERGRSQYGDRGAQLFALQDATIAATYAQLAAAAEGLGSCWVGAFDDARVREVLAIPDRLRPIAILAVGYPAELPEPRTRRNLNDLLRRERY